MTTANAGFRDAPLRNKKPEAGVAAGFGLFVRATTEQRRELSPFAVRKAALGCGSGW
jgi:hypothetical protein